MADAFNGGVGWAIKISIRFPRELTQPFYSSFFNVARLLVLLRTLVRAAK